jgi:hypothetical protein
MSDSATFDLAIHLGPGVTPIAPISEDDQRIRTPSGEDSTDPNKTEVPCSCRFVFGIGMAIFIVSALTLILILYLLCQLDYQVDEKCYYKEHRMSNSTRSYNRNL